MGAICHALCAHVDCLSGLIHQLTCDRLPRKADTAKYRMVRNWYQASNCELPFCNNHPRLVQQS